MFCGYKFWVDSGNLKTFTIHSLRSANLFFHIKDFLSPLQSMDPCPHATPYEALRTSPVSSEREEGEIVDDEFEDISDNSISLPLSGYGKSVSAREHLPALCLSSVTDDDDDHTFFYEKTVKKRKKTFNKRKHRKHIVSNSDSDDEEFVTLDKELQEQLKAAIRVDNANEEQRNNSLRTRLRGMSKNENNLEKEANSNSEELDTELYALRSEALKTAVLNKFKYRKRKLNNLDERSSKDASQAIESKLKNVTDSIQPKNKVLCLEGIEEKLEKIKEDEYGNMEKDDNDEDEDVLRALLLASMAKKITKNTENIEVKAVEQSSPKVQPTVKPEFKMTSKAGKNSIFKTHPLQLPRVKPLIINLNDDSDSEDNNFIKRSVPLKSNPSINNIADIETAVDAFLKSQRAKVEAKEVLKQDETNKLDKSCVKLLPKNKQLEYKNLIKKLEDAKKMRLRKTTLKTNLLAKMNIKNKNRVLINKHIEVNKKGPTRDTNEDLKILQKTLKEMQISNDGKFQIQHKYASLLPTIKKITESSSERRKYDEQVKTLLQELNEIKKKSFAAHQNFSIHVKELIAKKEEIDRNISKNRNHIVTSTPLKKNIDLLSETSKRLPTSNPNKENKLNGDNGTSGQDIISAGKFKEDGTNDTEQPNSNIPQYISPLDTVERIIDPFSIMCPYDIDGNCCDPECIYNHYCEK
nr:unnamed protein product [Callosobruchus analis]